jgi:hypothetical protein
VLAYRPVPQPRPKKRLFGRPRVPPIPSFNQFPVADPGYEAGWFRWALADCGIQPCIPARRRCKRATLHDPILYRQPLRMKYMFARLKGRRTRTTRYDRCADLFLSVGAPAAAVLFWL